MNRCPWCGTDPLYQRYHDEEWGSPVHNDRLWFEFLLLEGAQAGLSWLTILRRREGYRAAFDDFDVQRIAGYDQERIEQLITDPRIIRNRRKVESAVGNARAFKSVVQERGSFDAYIWSWVDGRPIQNSWQCMDEVPADTPLSHRLSKDLKRRGFSFVGPTIVYALMQATGLVNDHLVDCYRHEQLR